MHGKIACVQKLLEAGANVCQNFFFPLSNLDVFLVNQLSKVLIMMGFVYNLLDIDV